MGRRVVTESAVDELEPGRHFSFEHIAGPIPVGGEYLVEAVGDGTKLTDTLRAELRGVWGLAAPYLKRSGSKMMARSLENLRARLDPSAARAGGSSPGGDAILPRAAAPDGAPAGRADRGRIRPSGQRHPPRVGWASSERTRRETRPCGRPDEAAGVAA